MRASGVAGTIAGCLLLALSPGGIQAQRTTSDQAIFGAQWMARRNPGDARAYYRLGDAYIQKARESGDISYFRLAEDALGKALAIAPDYAGAARHLAYVLYARHAFEEAAREAARAIEMDPADPHAYGILGDAHLEVGRYEAAEQAYGRMMRFGEDLYSLGRLAGLKSLKGDNEGAIRDLQRAIREGKANGRRAESIAWAEWQLGNEHFATGDLEEAGARYADSLRTYPNYHRALAGLAQVRAAQDRSHEAIDLYREAIAVIPQLEYIAALGDVYTRIGRATDAKTQYDLVEYIGRLNSLNKVLYSREMAVFYADHDMKLEQALALARREIGARRDVYGYDVLAWALYKNGDAEGAVAAMANALKLGTRDARLFFHAGMIYRRLGRPERAEEYLRRVLATNPRFHVLHSEVARDALGELERERAAGVPGEAVGVH